MRLRVVKGLSGMTKTEYGRSVSIQRVVKGGGTWRPHRKGVRIGCVYEDRGSSQETQCSGACVRTPEASGSSFSIQC